MKRTKYTLVCHKGHIGDFATEWWTDEQWKEHKEFVQKCIDDGTYGEEFEVEMELEHNPLYDSTPKQTPSIESYRLVLLDFNK